MNDKKCPICKKTKSVDEFNRYFSKDRNKYRISNYCKPCSKIQARDRSNKYYQLNKEKRKEYQIQYRKKNPEKVKELKSKFKKIYVKNLQNCYVSEMASRFFKCSIKQIKENPELLKTYKINLQIKRKIKRNG